MRKHLLYARLMALGSTVMVARMGVRNMLD